MSRTLFAISDDLLALNDLLEQLDGDVTNPEVDAAVTKWFAELASDESKKLDGYAGYIKQMEMESVAAKAEADQWAAKARTRDNRVKWLKERVKVYLELTGRTKATTDTGRTFAIQNNGGVVPLIIAELTDPKTVDPKFQKVTYSFDSEAIRQALADGGTLDWARLEKRGTHLRLK